MISRNGTFSRLARRFVAGEDLREAVEEIRSLNQRGIKATIDHLGENVTDRRSAKAASEVYLEILDAIREEQLEANASLKLIQLGLDIEEEFCLENLLRLAARDEGDRNFVRIDMESSGYTERTLRTFKKARASWRNLGIVIQSYLYRSEADIEELNRLHARVRLCKGAYRESKDIAYPRKGDVDENYLKLARILLEKGTCPAIATHDERMIEGTKKMAGELNLTPKDFEFQMLYGIRRDLQRRLVEEGYTMRVYVAYGKKWAPYFMRRLAERPANIAFLLKNLARERN